MEEGGTRVIFESFAQMLELLPDDGSCREYLEMVRWKGVPTCTKCAVADAGHYRLKAKGEFKGLYKCRACKERFTVTVGTMFEGSHIGLRKWFIAMYIFTSHKKGISSHQLGRDLGISQKSAWFLLSRLRYAFSDTCTDPLVGSDIEVDETFVSGRNKNRHQNKKVPHSQGRSHKDKTPVLGMIARGGNVIAKVVPDTKQNTVEPIIKEYIKPGSNVYTDEWHAYNRLNKTYNHKRVNHSAKEFVNGMAHTNTIEGFWSHLKRGIFGIYHWVSRKHLQRYVDEFTLRYNTRKMSLQGRFDLVMAGTAGRRLMYKELIL